MEIKTIQEAIASHAFWKAALRRAITSGVATLSPKEAASALDCDLGHWLDHQQEASASLQNVKAAHRAFHEAAAQVLQFVEDGDIEAAKASMALQGDFFTKSADLTMALKEWLPSDKL